MICSLLAEKEIQMIALCGCWPEKITADLWKAIAAKKLCSDNCFDAQRDSVKGSNMYGYTRFGTGTQVKKLKADME